MSDWNDAIEAAAKYHEEKMRVCEAIARANADLPFGRENVLRAYDHKEDADEIRSLKRPAEQDGGWNHDIAAAPMFLPIICFVRASRIPIQEESDMQYIAFQKRPGVFTLQDDDHTIIAPTCWRHLSAAPAAGER